MLAWRIVPEQNPDRNLDCVERLGADDVAAFGAQSRDIAVCTLSHDG